jgi:hypothetical protein
VYVRPGGFAPYIHGQVVATYEQSLSKFEPVVWVKWVGYGENEDYHEGQPMADHLKDVVLAKDYVRRSEQEPSGSGSKKRGVSPEQQASGSTSKKNRARPEHRASGSDSKKRGVSPEKPASASTSKKRRTRAERRSSGSGSK